MKKTNSELRDRLKRAGVTMWQLGDAWGGVSEMTVVRRFRKELDPQAKAEVGSLIEKLGHSRGTTDREGMN